MRGVESLPSAELKDRVSGAEGRRPTACRTLWWRRIGRTPKRTEVPSPTPPRATHASPLRHPTLAASHAHRLSRLLLRNQWRHAVRGTRRYRGAARCATRRTGVAAARWLRTAVGAGDARGDRGDQGGRGAGWGTAAAPGTGRRAGHH